MKKVLKIILLYFLLAAALPGRSNVLTSPFHKFQYDFRAKSYFTKAQEYYNQFNIDSSRIYLEKACEIYRIAGEKELYINALISISENNVYLKNYTLANEFLVRAENECKQLPENKKLENRINLAKGYYYCGKGQFEKSNDFLLKYVQICKELKQNDSLLSNPYLYTAYNYHVIGEYLKSIKAYKNTLLCYSLCKNTKPISYAYVLKNLARVYLRINDFESAQSCINICLNIYQKDENQFTTEYAQALLTFGYIKKDQGLFLESQKYFNQSESLSKKFKIKDDYLLSSMNYAKASMASIGGDYESALLFYNQALEHIQGNAASEVTNISIYYNSIAETYIRIGEYSKASSLIEKSILLIKPLNQQILGSSYNLASECYLKLNEPPKAIGYYNLSVKNITQYLGADHSSLARAHLTRARISLHLKSYEEGNKYASLALEIATKKFGNKHPLIAEAFQLQGDLALASGKTEDALNYYQQAVCAISRGYENKNVFSNPKNDQAIAPMQLLSILKSKAEALTQSGEKQTSLNKQHAYYDAALQSYDLADQLVAALRTGYTSRESKLMLADAESETYNKATRLAVKMFNETKNQKYLETAFSLSEKNKSSVLLGSLRDDESLAGAGISPKMIQYEKSLKQNIGLLENMIYEEDAKPSADPKKRSGYESRLLAFRQEHSRLLSQLEKYSPAYVRLKYKNNTASLANIQKMMAPKTAIVEYALVDSMMYTFLIIHDQVNVISHTTDSNFYKLIADFRSSLTDNDFSDYSMDDYSAYVRSASKLYDQLLLPVKKELEGKSVIFIPEDKLGYIPFEALLTSLPTIGKVDFNNLPYVIASNPVSYSYSATLLSAPFHNNATTQTENRMLAYAPDYISSATSTNAKYRSYTTRNGLQNLPAAAEEVNQIEKYFDIVKVDGREATEEQFKKESKDFDVLHLAMHAVVDNENPQFSKLVFAPGDTAEDGLLNASEIMNMDLKARMVVLSACNTGFGKILRGEGVFSVARAFLYAGCSSVVMTLWSVEDNSSAQLMDYFYSNLSKGETKDLALQQAKLNYIRNVDPVKAHPYFWAGYVNIGNTAAITEPKDAGANESWPYLTGAGVLGFTLVFAFRRKVFTLFAR
ncbi:MAG: CHAT domain-containing tetratricopeptide repeat protein [Bacteroidota bacterium]